MRRRVGAAWRWQSLPRVFVLQAILAWIIGVPLYAVMSGGPQGWSWLDAVAVVVWAVGFTFEALGDVQLTAFIRNPANRGHTMQSGLWSVTRHPNYFGTRPSGGRTGCSRWRPAAGGRSSAPSR